MNTVKYLSIVSLSCLLLVCTGCTDALDKKDLNSITDKDVWSNPKYATAFLDALHRENAPGWSSETAPDSDEAGPINGAVSAVLFGNLTSNSFTLWPYDQIRNICIFLENVDQSSFDETTRNRLKAQALVLRAWRYFEMVRMYGGVPMLLHSQTLSDDLFVKRDKTSDCIRLIVQDLDDAIALAGFPYTWTGDDAGRISKAAALALKGRVLLYWASPQFNPNNQQDRWQTAYNANKEAKELLEQNGYGLYENFTNIWFDEMNKEVVFVKRYQYPNLGHAWDAASRPSEPSVNLQASNTGRPSWELAKSFPMITGEPVDESADYDDVLFWKNRDPRFAQTIVWNSCLWELYNITGRRQWTYSEPNTPSLTHMYYRKAVKEKADVAEAKGGYNNTDWIEIRFAEVLMNYAECAAALGKTDEAYPVLKQIRNRAGILPGSGSMYGLKANMSQDEMIRAILLERKIEFAFEEKRFWDLRRWRLFASELNGKKRHGRLPVLLIPAADFEPLKSTANFRDDYALYFKDEVEEADKIYTMDFKDNYYFYPIHNDHLNRNSKLEQTQGWDNGKFNPLE